MREKIFSRAGKLYRQNIIGEIEPMDMEEEIQKMMIPVKCNHCGRVYDLCKTEPIQRFMDCTVYKTPCCHKVVDDRGGDGLFGVSRPAFERIDKSKIEGYESF